MEEWKKVRLGDCIKEINERTTENNQYEVLTSSKSGIYCFGRALRDNGHKRDPTPPDNTTLITFDIFIISI